MAQSKKRPRFGRELRAEFIERLSRTANVSESCMVVGVPRRTAYNWRGADDEFAMKWDEAVGLGTDALEDEAIRRACEGVEEPVFYQGKQVGSVRRYSDTLLIFMLKARRPEKYRERVEPAPKGSVRLVMNFGDPDDVDG